MHKEAIGKSHKDIVNQVKEKEESVHEYKSYVPIGNAAEKLRTWARNGAAIIYLTSRKNAKEIKQIKEVLNKNKFPEGRILSRKSNEEYKDIAERVIPNVLIEDDCESIGGASRMTFTNIKPSIKKKIKLIMVKEFGGIDHLSDNLKDLSKT